ncbi:hypothetical protein CRG98_031474 [Punica granatum]|uniref:Uncharacterized protein n=1 Tax=Punica granatum TaxID=22663 RepID=A0A2I0IVT5_PUNGR|nr:hypothetical protein CRG98_031474 [Punica granatum]
MTLLYGICTHPNFIPSGHACACLCNAAWEYPPFRRSATDAREKESPLPFYDLKVEGRLWVSSRRNGHWWIVLRKL